VTVDQAILDTGLVDLSAEHSRRARASHAALYVGIAVVAGFVLAAITAQWLPIPNPYAVNYDAVLSPPSIGHPFGTDDVGRDQLSRVVWGARIDLLLGFVGTYASLVIGVIAGTVAGYWGGWRETLIMRVVDTFFAFPFIVLVLIMVAIAGPGVLGVYIGIIVASWPLYARLTHAEMRVLREKDFMLATKTLGFSSLRTIVRHAVPNLLRPNLVVSCSDVVSNVLVFASLSYLGVGVQPPTPEWGAIIAGGHTYLLTAWWISTIPGLVVVVFGVGVTLLGDGLADRWISSSTGL
jgi:peptide/nickel transport system permease protein